MKAKFIIIFLIGLLIYLPSFFGPFLWDDEDFVYANQYVKDFRIEKFFSDSQTAGRGKLSNYYRPLPQLSHSITHAIFGFTPFWFHFLNVLIHIGAACTIFVFFKFLLEENDMRKFQFLDAHLNPARENRAPKDESTSVHVALLISLFFLIHPVQTEAVSYISGLSDPLFTVFGFLSLLYFLKTKSWWSLGFFVLALLSKETALIFLPLLLVLGILTKTWKKLWPFLTTALLYLWFHFSNPNLTSLDINAAWGTSVYVTSITTRLLTFIQNLYLYVGLLIFPQNLFMERDFTIHIQENFLNPYLLGFAIFIATASIFFYQKSRSPNFRLLLFCFLGFFISFVPYTGILLINGMFYEHFLYVPLIFFFAFWLILFKSYLKNKYVLYFLIGVLSLFALRNFIRQFDWNDSIRFYTQTLTHAPTSVRILNGLGMAYAEKGDFQIALATYNQAVKLNPKVPNLYHNIANIYAAEGKLDLAEKNYLKALEVDPNFLYSAQSLASLYQQTNQREKLEALIKKYSR